AVRFGQLVKTFSNPPHVPPPEAGQKFGSNGLKFKGKLFAMLVRDELVVKLPRPRVDALIAAGDGRRMVSGGAREMKEWLVLDGRSSQDWTALAREACAFVKQSA